MSVENIDVTSIDNEGPKPTVLFFARVKDRSALERVEFYRQDICILQDLGYTVVIATKIRELRRADLFFVWWWTWAFAPVLVARLLKIPVIVTGTFNYGLYPRRNWIHRALIRYALQRSSANVFVSKMEYSWVTSQLKVTNPCYSPHIVDTSAYSPGANNRGNVVFSVAWLKKENVYRKSIAEIVDAAAIVCKQCPDLRFVIAGKKEDGYPALLRKVNESGLSDRVEFVGSISREEKIKYMQTCILYLQPSKFEGFGLAILEAMACGAPVITSAVGAVPEVVGDAALLVNGRAPSDIAEGILQLQQNEELRIGLGQMARKRALDYFTFSRRRQDLGTIVNDVFINNRGIT